MASSPVKVHTVVSQDENIDSVASNLDSPSRDDAPHPNESNRKEKNRGDGMISGLTDNVVELTETPDEALARILLPGEVIKAQFDCYFPDGMIPVWKLVMLCFMTLGLYLFVLAFRAIRRCCYKYRCCTPSLLTYKRGKLGITNKGRLICWNEKVVQVKTEPSDGTMMKCAKTFCCWLLPIWYCFCKPCTLFLRSLCGCKDMCAAPTQYEIKQHTRVYGASSIRQVSQYYKSSAAFLCCCVEYECGIEVSIDEFNFGFHDSSATTTQEPGSSYFDKLSGLLDATTEGVEAVVGIYQKNIIRVLSNTFDRYHNGDIHEVLADLAVLHGEIISSLPMMDDCFVHNPDLALGKNSKMDTTDKFVGVTIVSDNRTVMIPSQWLPMMEGEEIIATNGECYMMSCWEWFLTIITFGYYYCKNVRHLKYDRSALILTNKRIIDIDIFHRAGEVPWHLANFSIKCRSFLPGRVTAGYLLSKDNKNLSSSLLCDGGQLIMTFPSGLDALPFARATHMSAHRHMTRINLDKGEMVRECKSALSQWDLDNALPLMPNETLIGSVESPRTWLPYCSDVSWIGGKCLKFVNSWRLICRDRFLCLSCTPVANACSKEACGCCWPYGTYAFSCLLRPFQNNDDILMTQSTIFRYTRAGNFGCCAMGDNCMQTKAYFLMSWLPITDMIGQNFDVDAKGDEKCLTRCCRGNILGRMCCPIGMASFTFDVDCRHINFGIHGEQANKNWNKDPELLAITKTIGQIQIGIEEQARIGLGGKAITNVGRFKDPVVAKASGVDWNAGKVEKV